MATLKIDGKEITVADNTLILDAAKEAGVTIPTFCYQADLSRLGSCRICLIEIEGQRKLQPACVTPVMQDMEVFTKSETVTTARSGVLEFFLSNHAMDCPVCDKGGECELQNMVYKHGPHEGAHAEKKVRFHEKDYPLSPVIIKNSNRCVQCQRCVRVCREAVGRGVLGSQGRGAHQEETSFLRTELDCDHCGNCIEVCPVGCFMRRPYRYKSRPWDLKSAATICPYCATGCSMTIQERDGTVVRSLSKFGTGVNNELMCARGRFGFDFVNHDARLTTPLKKNEAGEFEEISWVDAIDLIKKKFHYHTGTRIGALASARLPNEELYIFQKMMRELFKTENIDSSVRWDSEAVKSFVAATGMTDGGTTIRGALKSDTVLIVGSHISDENPVTDYLLRLSFDTSRTEVIIASPRAMKLDRSAKLTLRNAPASEGSLLTALAAIIYSEKKEDVGGFIWSEALGESFIDSLVEATGVSVEDLNVAAQSLINAESVSLFTGTDFLRHPESIPGLVILTDLLLAMGKTVSTLPLLDRSNQRGAWDMGLLPGFGPGFKSSREAGLNFDEMLTAAINNELDTMYIVGSDVLNLYPGEPYAKEALSKLDFLVVQDIFMTDTARMADLILPGASFAEKDGTYTNQEGRVQGSAALIKAPGRARKDFDIFKRIALSIEPDFTPTSTKKAFSEIKEVNPLYANIALSREKDDASLVVAAATNLDCTPELESDEPVAVDAKRQGDSGGDFKLITGNHLFFSGTLSVRSALLNELLTDPVVEISEADADRLGLKSGESVVVKGEHRSNLYILRTNKGSRDGVAFIAENYAEAPTNRYFKRGEAAPYVSIKKA